MKNIDKVKAQIQSMMLKARDVAATEAEAASAMAMAQKLMEKFGVTEQDIVERPDEIGFEERHARHDYVALHEVDSLLANRIAEYCGCQVWASNTNERGAPDKVRHVVFFGIDSDVELAMYLRHALHEAMNYSWKTYKQAYYVRGEDDLRTMRREHMAGFAVALRKRLEAYSAEAKTGTDLIVLKDQLVTQEMAKRGISLGRARSSRRRYSGSDVGAFESGFQSGNNADIGRATGGGSAGLLT